MAYRRAYSARAYWRTQSFGVRYYSWLCIQAQRSLRYITDTYIPTLMYVRPHTIDMATQATIVVPTTKDGAEIVAQTVATELANEYGGSSMVEQSGWWENNDGLCVSDESMAVYTNVPDGELDRDRIREIAEWVEAELGEDSVMYTFQDIEVQFT